MITDAHRKQAATEAATSMPDATPGMWPRSLNDPIAVAAAKVLTDAGFAPAMIYGDAVHRCTDANGWYIPNRPGRTGPVTIRHVVNGSFKTPSGDYWYEQLKQYRQAFRAAGWQVEPWEVETVHAEPPTEKPTA
ncbi:hypothetical protein FLW53_09715 [Microbispora sp. SCL1-1]|uniref:hypothetical protein n=1 Tax=unclassified Microbispora TaxID=2614687 RepID=UPI001157009B|nr:MULTISPECIES: hypothetical protein [unclassified Microbispora]NJP24481.1 hypothetical protein [Microbispora sp. CL1-1]TQS14627.1 hypothetical protein FLW53_09715 [Microbispora sp. SCL1-1]